MGKANRGRDTAPEVRLRSELHRRGLRYRVNRRAAKDLRVRVDIVFGPARVAVFVDGCFWHRCPLHATTPKANRDWWMEKLEVNVARDRRNDEELRARGWNVMRVWEHEDPAEAADRISRAVRGAPLQPPTAADGTR
jgi:DNA mismatch endonuclease, patch repair protein